MEVSIKQIQELRQLTGAGMMDCKQALLEENGDLDKAKDNLRKKGISISLLKAGRTALEGTVGSYIHLGGRIGVLIEVNCETDFVGKSVEFQDFVKDMCMHIAASNPQYVGRDDVPKVVVDKEKAFLTTQAAEQGKPANVIDKIVDGRLNKFFEENCLLEQPFVKDKDKKVSDVLNELVIKIREKIVIKRFTRYQLGI